MAWSKIQDNSKRASIGASTLSFVRRIGSLRTTFSRSAALAKLHKSSASPMQPYFSGSKNTASSAVQLQRPAASSIGGHLDQITQCGTSSENSIQTGAAVSRQIAKPSMRAKNGNQLAARCGRATRPPASVAALYTTKVCHSTFTTSHPSRRKHCGQRYRTYFLSASLAINGFIQEGM